MTRYTLTIGMGKDRDGQHIFPADRLKMLAESRDYITTRLSGFTEHYVTGVWTSPTEQIVMELAIQFEMISDHPISKLREIALRLKEVFHQTSVMLTSQPVYGEFL